MSLPCRAEVLTDDPVIRTRALRIQQRSTQAIADAVHELADLGLVKTATVQVRLHQTAPAFKFYVINRERVFFGFYPVVEHTVRIQGEPHELYDVMGKDAPALPLRDHRRPHLDGLAVTWDCGRPARQGSGGAVPAEPETQMHPSDPPSRPVVQ